MRTSTTLNATMVRRAALRPRQPIQTRHHDDRQDHPGEHRERLLRLQAQ